MDHTWHMDTAQRLKCSATCLALSALERQTTDGKAMSHAADAELQQGARQPITCITYTPSYLTLSRLCTLLLLLATLFTPAYSCGPGRGIGGSRRIRKLTPLVFKQHVPNMSEKTLGASGPNEGAIRRNSSRFKDLVPNYNKDIIFQDEEGTGADRVMTRRCKEKLNTLAVSVMNEWPGVRLRVIESWSEGRIHGPESLHYEGRAVDITTSDRDNSKYGMLARLAVEAGFDWVYYVSRRHIYCSVKSDSSTISHVHGCFTPESTVLTESGARKPMSEVRVGDRVLSMNAKGEAVYSEVILFMDRNLEQAEDFVQLRTDGGAVLSVTPAHLLLVWSAERQISDYVFADRVEEGDHVLVHDAHGELRPQRVVAVRAVRSKGVVAPLTREGTIVVNSVAASCYAVLNSQALAHWGLAPMRLWATLKSWLPARGQLQAARPALSSGNATAESKSRLAAATAAAAAPSTAQVQNGVHWYAKALYQVKDYVVPRSWRYQ